MHYLSICIIYFLNKNDDRQRGTFETIWSGAAINVYFHPWLISKIIFCNELSLYVYMYICIFTYSIVENPKTPHLLPEMKKKSCKSGYLCRNQQTLHNIAYCIILPERGLNNLIIMSIHFLSWDSSISWCFRITESILLVAFYLFRFVYILAFRCRKHSRCSEWSREAL